VEIKNVEPRSMYTMFDIVFNDKGITYFENVISYPKELVELLEKIDEDQNSYDVIPKWSQWGASNDPEHSYGLSKFIFTEKRKSDTGNQMLNKNILYIINSLMMAPEMCAKRIADMQGMKESPNLALDYIKIGKYSTGKGMGPHCDAEDPNGTGLNLKYSLVCYLNDDYEGGEIYFKNQDIKIKPKAGSLVFFPSTHPYLHESLPVKSGNKIMYTTHWVI
jgi:hypothetical protein